jgi:hypothetical protein
MRRNNGCASSLTGSIGKPPADPLLQSSHSWPALRSGFSSLSCQRHKSTAPPRTARAVNVADKRRNDWRGVIEISGQCLVLASSVFVQCLAWHTRLCPKDLNGLLRLFRCASAIFERKPILATTRSDSGALTMFALMQSTRLESLHLSVDPVTGLKAVIAIHNSRSRACPGRLSLPCLSRATNPRSRMPFALPKA